MCNFLSKQYQISMKCLMSIRDWFDPALCQWRKNMSYATLWYLIQPFFYQDYTRCPKTFKQWKIMLNDLIDGFSMKYLIQTCRQKFFFCKCVDDEGDTKEFNFNQGLWCCNTETCTEEFEDDVDYYNVTCRGKAIPLTEKCLSGIHDANECNSYVGMSGYHFFHISG